MSVSDKVLNTSEILLFGRGRSAASIAVCLAASGSEVTLISDHPGLDKSRIKQHQEDLSRYSGKNTIAQIHVTKEEKTGLTPSLVVITGYSDPIGILPIIHHMEELYSYNLIITIATDHIPLALLQEKAKRPEQILVMNWAEPAHTTFFLEIVHNRTTDPGIVSHLEKSAKEYWGKDPYTVHSELGVRGRMMTAIFREALFLVEEGYANVNDIDRACRNDAGTYLPFAGHFQYMDLMGTYAYGVVMEKLNKELSNAIEVPPFFDEAVSGNSNGMTNGKGFYDYTKKEVEDWEENMQGFSFEIRKLMEEYPFGYLENDG